MKDSHFLKFGFLFIFSFTTLFFNSSFAYIGGAGDAGGQKFQNGGGSGGNGGGGGPGCGPKPNGDGNGGGGGGDRPDDTQDVSSFIYNLHPSENASVVVLRSGAWQDTCSLLEYLNIPYAVHSIFDITDIYKDHPIMVIPDGGLFGMENSLIFRSQLEEYAESGGVIFCFTQQHGYEFSALPGGEVGGYGWSEDISCWANAAYIDTYHPIMAGQDSVNLTANVDGYITKHPKNTTILLYRTKNKEASMILYPYGKGYVIASCLYTDYGYGHSQASSDEFRLIKDLITWASDPKREIKEFRPEDAIDYQLVIINYQLQDAKKVRIKLYDPDYNLLSSITVGYLLKPSNVGTITFLYPSQSKLGLYKICYELLDESDNIIQEEESNGIFAVSYHFQQSHKPEGLSFWVTAPAETLIEGSDVGLGYLEKGKNYC